MSAILNPKMGFSAQLEQGNVDGKITRSGLEAARRKFPPEFVNRPDKIVVFKPLGKPELSKILDIELGMVQNRVFETSGPNAFLFNATDEAKDLLLEQGTDAKYGARPLKRAIEKLLVHPMSNLIATEQIRGGDIVKVDIDSEARELCFLREAVEQSGSRHSRRRSRRLVRCRTAAYESQIVPLTFLSRCKRFRRSLP
jgi:ATP-dependent Clp protease ATP-binding subunit ClpB